MKRERILSRTFCRALLASTILLASAALPVRAADLLIGPLSHPTLPLQASAFFHYNGTDLEVTLTNTAQTDVMDPAEILTSFYFEISGPLLTLTKISATDTNPSMLMFGPGSSGMSHDPLPGGVGGEWAMWRGLTNAPFGQRYSINSAGLGLTGVADGPFPGANLDGPGMVDGLQYGISTATDNPATGNTPVTGAGGPLIRNQVKFVVGGVPSGFDPMATISNVQFQYGTTRCDVPGTVDRCIPDVPEPATGCLLALAALAAGMRSRRTLRS
jgi:hypothetical protein